MSTNSSLDRIRRKKSKLYHSQTPNDHLRTPTQTPILNFDDAMNTEIIRIDSNRVPDPSETEPFMRPQLYGESVALEIGDERDSMNRIQLVISTDVTPVFLFRFFVYFIL